MILYSSEQLLHSFPERQCVCLQRCEHPGGLSLPVSDITLEPTELATEGQTVSGVPIFWHIMEHPQWVLPVAAMTSLHPKIPSEIAATIITSVMTTASAMKFFILITLPPHWIDNNFLEERRRYTRVCSSLLLPSSPSLSVFSDSHRH